MLGASKVLSMVCSEGTIVAMMFNVLSRLIIQDQ